MLARVLEPEVMDSAEEAASYDSMDHRAINKSFVEEALLLCPAPRRVLDVGTGPGWIPILTALQCPEARIVGVDLAEEMMRIARRNVEKEGLSNRIDIVRADAKQLPFAPGDFDLVISSSMLHHIPDPRLVLAEVDRVVGGGAILVRDLHRPESEHQLEDLVARYVDPSDETGKRTFAESLRASLSLDEVRAIVNEIGMRDVAVAMSSDRHWSLQRKSAV
jgi:ubiquinone/menaquinone biosynthesis C-methylase UbiE